MLAKKSLKKQKEARAGAKKDCTDPKKDSDGSNKMAAAEQTASKLENAMAETTAKLVDNTQRKEKAKQLAKSKLAKSKQRTAKAKVELKKVTSSGAKAKMLQKEASKLKKSNPEKAKSLLKQVKKLHKEVKVAKRDIKKDVKKASADKKAALIAKKKESKFGQAIKQAHKHLEEAKSSYQSNQKKAYTVTLSSVSPITAMPPPQDGESKAVSPSIPSSPQALKQVAKLEKAEAKEEAQEANAVMKKLKASVSTEKKLNKKEGISVAASTVALAKSLKTKLDQQQDRAADAKEIMLALENAKARQQSEAAAVKEAQAWVTQLQSYSTPHPEDHAKLLNFKEEALAVLTKRQERLKTTESYVEKLTTLSGKEGAQESDVASKQDAPPTKMDDVKQLEAKNKAMEAQTAEKDKQQKVKDKAREKIADAKQNEQEAAVKKRDTDLQKKNDKKAKKAMQKSEKEIKEQITEAKKAKGEDKKIKQKINANENAKIGSNRIDMTKRTKSTKSVSWNIPHNNKQAYL